MLQFSMKGTLQRNLPRGFISGSARFMAADLAKYWGPLRTADFLNRSPLYASNVVRPLALVGRRWHATVV